MGFLSRINEARRLKDFGQASTPQLLALLDALLAQGTPAAEELADQVLRGVLGQRDPALAWTRLRDDAAAGRKTSSRAIPGASELFRLWAKRDPVEALAAWHRDAPSLIQSGKMERESFGAISSSWAISDPASALDAVEQINDPMLRGIAAESAIGAISLYLKGDPATWPEGADLLANRPLALAGEKVRIGWGRIIEASLKYQLPAETVAWADQLKASPDQRISMDKVMADAWMSRDALAAADWYVERAAGRNEAARDQALERAIRKWTKVDEEHGYMGEPGTPVDLTAASEWLIAQGLGTHSQAAMATLARARGQASEPERALAWVKAVPDESARSQALEVVMDEIRQRFPNDWQRLTGP